jgi:hypothetical protein
MRLLRIPVEGDEKIGVDIELFIYWTHVPHARLRAEDHHPNPQSSAITHHSSPLMTPPPIVVPLPFIRDVLVRRRVRYGRTESVPQLRMTFYPPNSAQDWPKTFKDIKDEDMKKRLIYVEGAIGSNIPGPGFILCIYRPGSYVVFADGIIYTDDTIFWLSKVCEGIPYYFAYGASPPYIANPCPWTMTDICGNQKHHRMPQNAASGTLTAIEEKNPCMRTSFLFTSARQTIPRSSLRISRTGIVSSQSL